MDSRRTDVFDFHLTTNADDLSEATLSTSKGSQTGSWSLASATSLPLEVGWPTLAKADVLASNLGWRREGGGRGALPRLLGGSWRWSWSLALATWLSLEVGWPTLES